MRKYPLVYFVAAMLITPLAFAGAGQTSSGVTTSVGTISDPTAATSNVNTQSSNFVQQNQTPLATSVTNASGTTTTLPNAPGTSGSKSANGTSNTVGPDGKPIDPNNPNAPPGTPGATASPAVPPPPPPPPPDYVSNMKKVDRSTATTTAVIPGVAVADKISGDAQKSTTPAAQDPSLGTAPSAPGLQRQTAPPTRTAETAAKDDSAHGAVEHANNMSGSSGGSGAAPDSYAFYIGLVVAGILLVFSAVTYLRAEKPK